MEKEQIELAREYVTLKSSPRLAVSDHSKAPLVAAFLEAFRGLDGDPVYSIVGEVESLLTLISQDRDLETYTSNVLHCAAMRLRLAMDLLERESTLAHAENDVHDDAAE